MILVQAAGLDHVSACLMDDELDAAPIADPGLTFFVVPQGQPARPPL
jgi:hypothetical protein